ncbi:MAG TPA: type II toxin-antitoxin system VapC family toxin [Solirubrobacterales bacterium]|nr:type II toxin-antitoxin system VapC family toxin [Solirubrobacterales bacterium]
MAAIVVDASVMAALYIEEPLSAPARAALLRAREAGDELHAPDLLLVECANAFWKRVDRGELERDSAMTAIGALSSLEELDRHPLDGHLVPAALSLAIAHSLTAHDAVYAALAVQLGGTAISGDRRFVKRAGEAGLPVVAVG